MTSATARKSNTESFPESKQLARTVLNALLLKGLVPTEAPHFVDWSSVSEEDIRHYKHRIISFEWRGSSDVAYARVAIDLRFQTIENYISTWYVPMINIEKFDREMPSRSMGKIILNGYFASALERPEPNSRYTF